MKRENTKTKNMVFAVYLTQLRLKLPLRDNRPVFKKEVAAEAGVNISSYSMAENGIMPGRGVLSALSEYFKVPIESFKINQTTPIPEEIPTSQEIKSELQDGEFPWGKTRQHEVEGTSPLTVTEFKPKEGQAKGPLRAAIEGLGEIFDSKDPVLIPTIEAVIHAARISAQREYQNKQQARQIKALEDECNEFKKRLEDLERKLEDNPPHDHKEEPTKRKAI